MVPKRHSTAPRTPTAADISARQATDRRRATTAVVMGLAITGLCGTALNWIAGPVVDGVGLLLASMLYGAIGFAPHVD